MATDAPPIGSPPSHGDCRGVACGTAGREKVGARSVAALTGFPDTGEVLVTDNVEPVKVICKPWKKLSRE